MISRKRIMLYHWLNKQNNSELILFFNGWGMDHNPVKHIDCSSFDVLEFHDYTSPDLVFDLAELANNYDSVYLVAWSLGVWAAAEILSNSEIQFKRAIAINGTVAPISDNYGLSPDVFQGTIDNWSEKSRFAFNRRMCRERDELDFFVSNSPDRSIESQKLELSALQDRIIHNDLSGSISFDLAVIGMYDKIFLPERQQQFWDGNAVESQILPAGHYFFKNVPDWRIILGL